MSWLHKLRGGLTAVPAAPAPRQVALAWLGSWLAVTALASASNVWHVTLLLGSFGASCVLVFGYPEVPFSQPRNIVGGHVLSAAVGLACLHAFGPHGWALALAVATAVAAMMALRIVHPPAGSNPVIVFLMAAPGAPGVHWDFLLFPVLGGAAGLVVVACAFHNFARKDAYPRYW